MTAIWTEFGILLGITTFYFFLAAFIVVHIARLWGFHDKARRR